MRIVKLSETISETKPDDFLEPFVIPTETVYGLAARCDQEESLRKIFKIKGRESDNPLIVHISSMEMLKSIVKEIPNEYQGLIASFWPGPLSLIFQAADGLSPVIQGGCMGTVAVRMPRNEHLRNIIEEIGVPLAAPSANTSGRPSPTRVEHAINDLQDKVKLYIDGGLCEEGLESTVFGFIDGIPTILRPGAISRESLEAVIKMKVQLKTNHKPGEKVLCPGQKYQHYAPLVPLYLFKGKSWRNSMNETAKRMNFKVVGLLCTDPLYTLEGQVKTVRYPMGEGLSEWAHNIFAVLRDLGGRCDAIFANSIETSDIGLAVMDRLSKAATYLID